MSVLLYGGSGTLCGEKSNRKIPDARAEWGQCVIEFGEMVSHEVKTNPRYDSIRKI